MENDKIIHEGVIKLSNYENAKELFLKYRGSHFNMDREGEYSIYKQYNISKKQELIWMDEWIKNLLKKINELGISNDYFSDFSIIPINYMTSKIIINLTDLIELKHSEWDTFSVLLISEKILKITKEIKTKSDKNNNIFKIKNILLKILRNITESSITISQYYKDLGYIIDLNKKSVFVRINELIDEIENL